MKPERALFDPFLVRDPFRWSGITGAWALADDQITLAGMGERRVTYRVDNEFRITLRARFVVPASGIEVRIETPTKTDSCRVSANALDYAGLPAAPISPGTNPFTLEVYYSNGQFGFASACVFMQGATSAQLQSGGFANQSRITLIGASVEVSGFDLVAGSPATN